jgi:hypothetical protein
MTFGDMLAKFFWLLNNSVEWAHHSFVVHSAIEGHSVASKIMKQL